MNAALLALGCLAPFSAGPSAPPPVTLLDTKDGQPVLVGAAAPRAILEHRPVFRANLAKVQVSPEQRARWQAVHRPLTLVAVFGSWCGDSHQHLPELLALEAQPNPFIEVRYLGVNRDKAADASAWPPGCTPQKVLRVPTFFLFAAEPGGTERLVGSVVEHPPRAGQSMAAALVELAGGAAPSQ